MQMVRVGLPRPKIWDGKSDRSHRRDSNWGELPLGDATQRSLVIFESASFHALSRFRRENAENSTRVPRDVASVRYFIQAVRLLKM